LHISYRSDVKGEIQQCINAGLTHLHIDIFDGVYINSPYALTFGPQMVHAIYNRFVVGNNNTNYNDKQQQQQQQQLVLDVHLCVDRPQRYAQAMVEAGATRIIYQWEAMMQQPNIDTNNSDINNIVNTNNHEENGESNKTILNKAIEFAQEITTVHKMKCGISINPSTDITSIFPLLDTGLIDLVDILAVEPGFGGQEFNPIALTKIKTLRHYIDNELRPKRGIDVIILVDGGINNATCVDVIHAGADILVAGE
jgi:ribulose-phosphate 3-epimerase